MSIVDEMVDAISEEHGVTKVSARRIVQVVFELIEDEMRDTGECAIPKFGKFVLAERGAHAGRNPQTGEPLEIAATTGVRFKPSSSLKARFNPEPRKGETVSARRAGPPSVRAQDREVA